jgi:anti-sigma factor RsiW
MTEGTRPVQEEDLHAFVDDRLDPRRRAEIEEALAADPALRRRVESWRAQRDALREAYAFKAREPVPAALDIGRLLERRATRPTRMRMVASIALALAVGALGGGAAGWFARGPQRPGEIARIGLEATAAYRVFAPDMIRPVEMDAKNRAELVSWMSARLGRPISVPDLSRLGYRFMGGRLVSAALGPAALLMYDDAQGTRITVYVLPMHGAMTEPLQPVRADAAGGYAWIDNRIGYGVISANDSPEMQMLAEQVRTEMR